MEIIHSNYKNDINFLIKKIIIYKIFDFYYILLIKDM